MLSTRIGMDIRDGLKVAVVNLGCKVNRVESDTIAARMIARGCVVRPVEDADLVIVNSCTVTKEADKKTRKAVRHALRVAPCARVVVTGCAVALDQKTFVAMDERVRVVQRVELMALLEALAGEEPLRLGGSFRTRVNVKVQDGCDRACTYCIVHIARGKAVSVPADKVLAQVRPYLMRGVKEIVLTGIDLGSYSHEGMSLADLVRQLMSCAAQSAAGGQQARLRASSLEPVSVDEQFIELMEQSEGLLCRHLHLPLQSGSTRVLQQMARPYTAEQFAQLVARLRKRVPGISLTTDIICGFPGETEDDFKRTMEMAHLCGFSKIHVFPYSMREGTPAAKRDDQVGHEVKEQRAQRLRKLSDALRQKDFESRRATTELALVEGDFMLTESYHELPALPGARQGDLVPVTFG